MSIVPSKSPPDRDVRELTDGDVHQFRTLSRSLILLTWMVAINSALIFAVSAKLFLY